MNNIFPNYLILFLALLPFMKSYFDKTLLSLLLLTALYSYCHAQNDSINAPYIKSKRLPEFTIYNASDSSAFSNTNLKKNVNTVFIIFNPDCEFCQHETRDLLNNIGRFKNTQIIMISFMSYESIKKFYNEYKIASYPIITMGRDDKYFSLKFFKIKIIPSTIVYDKNGNFKKIFQQRVDMDTLVKEL